MAAIQKYSEYILSDYYLELKRFAQGYDPKRLNIYLQATFSEFLQEEKLGKERFFPTRLLIPLRD